MNKLISISKKMSIVFTVLDFEPNNYFHTLLTRRFFNQQKGAATYESSLQDQLQFMRNYAPISKLTPIEFICDARIYEIITSHLGLNFINPYPIVAANDVEFAKRMLQKFRIYPLNVKDEELIYKIVENNFTLFAKLSAISFTKEIELMEKVSRKFLDNFENLDESEKREILSSKYGAIVLERYDRLEEERTKDIILNDEDFMEMYGCLINANQYEQVDLSRASYSLRGNQEFMKEFIEFDGMNLRFASGKLRNEWSFVEIALSNNVNAYQFATENLRNMSVWALEAVKKSTDTLQYIGSNLRSDMYFYSRLLEENIKFDIPSKDFVISLINYNPKNYLLIPLDSEYRLDKDVMLLAPNESIEEALRLYSTDRNLIREMMSKLKKPSKYFDESCQNDFEMIKGCMRLNPQLFRYASIEIRSNLEQVTLLIDYCVTPGGLFHLIIHSSHEIKQNKNFALRCVGKFGSSLQYLRHFWNDKEVVMKAVEQDFQSFSFASETLKLDCDLIKVSPKCLFLISDLSTHPIFADLEFLEECVTKHNLYLYCNSIPREIKKIYLFKNPSAYLAFNDCSDLDEETCLKILEKKENFQLYTRFTHFLYRKNRWNNNRPSFLERACKVNPLVDEFYGEHNNNSNNSVYFTKAIDKEQFIEKFNERMREISLCLHSNSQQDENLAINIDINSY
ncbi:predicted protein [Naegleria gruberi]|uniref:Predicted protein n=1 Tax=Naegleria gruberi TaxID=5762 RepID=D2VTE5_NAEGR|nr:uncharacterized protein NAEGRDRAFT_52102 [Naegleria gruberi]EFC39916.1 predicted protein [Naegleria gruberi]|eukprot:XP_002672660.1 predicted protein [Naegleria gruberi strain NEG-M]